MSLPIGYLIQSDHPRKDTHEKKNKNRLNRLHLNICANINMYMCMYAYMSICRNNKVKDAVILRTGCMKGVREGKEKGKGDVIYFN